MTPAERIEELRREIRRHEELYYVHAAPEISDAEFDALDARAARRSKPRIPSSSRPTRRRSAWAAGPAEGFVTVEHLAPMLSLDNAYDEEELRAFDERVRKGLGGVERRPRTWRSSRSTASASR